MREGNFHMSFLRKLDKNFEFVFLAGLLIIMTVLSFANVVMRYFFKAPIFWSDEICCYCLALSAFVCLPCSIRYKSAIRVDTFVTLLPKFLQKLLLVACDAIMVVFLCWCVKGGVDVAAIAARINQKSPALQIPVAYFYWFMTFCFGLAIFRSLQSIYLTFRGEDK